MGRGGGALSGAGGCSPPACVAAGLPVAGVATPTGGRPDAAIVMASLRLTRVGDYDCPKNDPASEPKGGR